ncbi:transglycosylase domain-containing protein [Picosynechococcus sp. PCC 7003]|uniref:transglycosylase domain-containing protein n=1 Tax=Picosynechococcus sp. PCC 7003 TaxID=374981 RepID=UPI001E30A956|nr:PBP1A family penicillin-binding protein [Picosynechococcus sp. PCC 7003]
MSQPLEDNTNQLQSGSQPGTSSEHDLQSVEMKAMDEGELTQTAVDKDSSPQKPKRSSKRRRWRLWLLAGLVLGVGSGGVLMYRGWQELEALVPENVDEILIYTRPGTLTIQAADGSVIEEVGPVSHDRVKIWAVPTTLTEAFIASEDRRFYEHFGVDLQGVARAAYMNFRVGRVVEGGSSITQQVARIVFLNQDMTLARKVKEMRLATKLEEQFSKEQILESYLNLVYLGSGAYGVSDAAWVYFGKSLDELTLGETAMLAGLAPAPSLYSPFVNLQAATVRRDQVLERMWEEGYISQTEYEAAIATPIETNRQTPQRLLRKYPYFADYVKAELKQYLSPEQLEMGSFVIETTLNPQWQEWSEAAVAKGITNYGRYQRFEQAAMVSIDPRSGQIKTMVGGLDFENNQYNRVTQAQRQPGSTFKMFVYAAAIASGMSPSTAYVDQEFSIDGYRPKNASGTFSNQAIPLTTALTQSVNTVALNLMLDVGWDPVISLAHRMGIESEMQPTYSLALGAWEVNLLELTSAYGTLANRGVHQPVYGISRILDRNGKVIYQAKQKPIQAIDPDSAAIMTYMLRNVVSSGTGSQANIGRPVAGKTGTTDRSRDLWFIGYIPQMVTGVWLGNDDNKPTWGASSTAARLWGDAMRQIAASMAVEDFPPLPNLNNRVGSIAAEPIQGGAKKTKAIATESSKKPTAASGNTTSQASSPSTENRKQPTSTTTATGTTTTNTATTETITKKAVANNDKIQPTAPAFDFSNPGDTVPPLAPLPSNNRPAAPTATPPSPPAAPRPAPTNVEVPAPPVIQKKEATP